MAHILSLVRDWEWVLLCAVALLECFILAHGEKERRQRAHLISEMANTRVELGRESYMAMKSAALAKARHYMYFVSESLNADASRREAERAFRRYRHVGDLRCITTADPARLHEIWEQHRHGVDVRVSPLVVASTFRFQLCDDCEVVLGFTEEGAELGVKGIQISNRHFSRMLLKHFEGMWNDAQPWQEFARSFVSSINGQEDAATLGDMFEQWGIQPEEAKEFRNAIDKCPSSSAGQTAGVSRRGSESAQSRRAEDPYVQQLQEQARRPSRRTIEHQRLSRPSPRILRILHRLPRMGEASRRRIDDADASSGIGPEDVEIVDYH